MAPPSRSQDRPRKRSRFEVGCALLTALMAHTVSAGGDAVATHQRQIDPLCALETERHRVELIKEGRCCPNEMELLIEDKNDGSLRSIEIESQLRKSATMRLAADSKLLIAGQLEHAATGVLVVDLDTGGLQDEIRASEYRLSPSKRRLVYTSFPAPRDSSTPRSEVLVYDLSSPTTAAHKSPNSPPGVAVFPDGSTPRHIHSPLVWSQDESRIALVADFDGELSLVSVDLADGLESPAIRRQRIDIADRPDQRPLFSLRWQDSDTVSLGLLGEDEPVAMKIP